MRIHIELMQSCSKNRAYVVIDYDVDEFLKRCKSLPKLDSICINCKVFKIRAWDISNNSITIFDENIVGKSLQEIIQKIEKALK